MRITADTFVRKRDDPAFHPIHNDELAHVTRALTQTSAPSEVTESQILGRL